MSHLSAAGPDFDFWEFVNCSRCHLPFIGEPGVSPTVPFWLTECGHVICNNHLNVDQSCAQCGERGIQLVPLQRDMDPPMSDWFRSVSLALDTVAYATRFQMDTLASLVRFYRNKCAQQRALLERLKGEHTENKTLKKTVDELRSENDQLRQYLEYGQSVPSETSNLNGKRQMLDIHRHASGARTNSSPSSIVAPIGPDRLTLRPDHQAPNFAPRHAQQRDEFMQPQVLQGQNASGYPQARDRPGSSRFAQHYAYAPPQTPRTQTMSMPTLTHAQSAPTRQALTRQPHVPATGPGQAHTAMMPPPAVTRDSQAQFQQKPKRDASGSVQQDQSEQSSHNANSRIQMPPPQTPLLQRTAIQQRSSIRPPPTPQLQASESAQRFIPQTPTRAGPNPSSGRFLPQQPQRRFQLPSMQSAGPQRFIGSVSGPGVISAGNPDSSSSSRAPSRAASISISGGQRVPFVPRS